MKDVSSRNFGLLIAYVVPGYIVLWGLSFLSPEIRWWLSGTEQVQPSIAAFLHISIASIAAGMTASGFRWAVLDSIHHRTGIRKPQWSDSVLHERIKGYDWLVENHYRYYQFYANSLISLTVAYSCWQISPSAHAIGVGILDFAALVCFVVFYAGSRNTLDRYYRRAESLLTEQGELK